MKKLTIVFLVVFIIFSVIVVFNILYQPHKDIATSDVDFKIDSKELFENFTSNETDALAKYCNKVIETKGKITAIDTENKNIILDSILFYQFDKEIDSQLKTDQIVTIKARLVGYDELMNEIKLDQSTIIK